MRNKHFLLWFVAITLITAAVILMGWEEIYAALKKVSAELMMLLVLLQFITLVALAGQWQYLLKKVNCPLSLGHVLAINLAANYIESVTPSVKLGGEAAKVYLLKRYSSLEYDFLSGILLALKFFSLLPFVLLSALAVTLAIYFLNFPVIGLYAFAFLAFFFIMIAALYYKKDAKKYCLTGRLQYKKNHDRAEKEVTPPLKLIPAKIARKLESAAAFINRASSYARSLTTPAETMALIAISALIWILYPVKVFLITGMMGLEVGFLAVIIVTFTAYLVSMVPLLPGGLGTFEGTMVLMLTGLGIAPAEGLTVALLSRFITFWIPLLWSALGAFYLAIWKPPAPGKRPVKAEDSAVKGIAALTRS